MAVKFSQFSAETNAANITNIVGYTTSGNLNVQIPPANLDTTYTLASSASGSNVVLTLDGTKPGGTATDDTITITQGSGITFSSVTAAGFTIAASGAVTTVDETTPGTSSGTPIVVNPTTGDVLIQSMAFAGAGNVGHVPSAAAASAGQFLDYTGNWSAPSGAFTGFSITDGATTEVVGNGDIVTFAGGTYINTAVTAADTVTITLDTAVALWRLAGGDGAGPIQSITPDNTATIKENTSTTVNSVIVGGGVQSLAANTDELLLDQKSEQVITVAGSVYVVDGASQPTIVLPRGFTYEFNQDDTSNNSHPIVIGTAAASSPYATGIQYYGSTSANTLTPVTQSDYANSTNFNSYATRRVRLRITQNTPALYYYCSVHGASYGGSITYGGSSGGFGSINQFTGTGSSLGALTLGSTPTAAQNCLVSISGVTQNYLDSSGAVNWTVSTNTLTFTTNPPVTAANGIQIIVIN
tara:strand:+ start:180 stop:1586 length:1407 start_codon:yes stop_codon:yes gene_type:complete